MTAKRSASRRAQPWEYGIKPTSGQYVTTAVDGPANSGNTAMKPQWVDFIPLILAYPITFDQVWFNVVTAGATNTVVRVGLYAPTPTNWPGTVIQDCGTVAATSTGAKSITVSGTIPSGFTWVAVSQQGSTTQQLVVSQSVAGVPYGGFIPRASPVTAGSEVSKLQQSGVSGAFATATGLVCTSVSASAPSLPIISFHLP